ncbi:hypothetical protein [Reyranella sp.]|uniref:hypothetical protein n=1 Tax=Reyranella sp. TaxID=1929291 RepID=UPI003C7DF130
MIAFIVMGEARPWPKLVVPSSVSFKSPPKRSNRAESVIVEDLGPADHRRSKNDEPPFWSEAGRR